MSFDPRKLTASATKNFASFRALRFAAVVLQQGRKTKRKARTVSVRDASPLLKPHPPFRSGSLKKSFSWIRDKSSD
jgi:hypothetical protein